jgi:S1-C subfamily serine protease
LQTTRIFDLVSQLQHDKKGKYMKIKTINGLLWAFICVVSAVQVEAAKLSSLFKQVSPSVVILHTFEKVPAMTKEKGLTSVQGLGSGVLISKDGKILTAAHVVQVADAVHVEFKNGKKSLAHVVASVPSADIALLQLDRVPEDAVAAPLGDSDTVEVGDDVFVIGAPYGASHTLTAGFISARRQADATNPVVQGEFFQTDAAINQGNSGGPLFNMKGEIVGIVSYIMTQSGGFEGLGFALTSNTAKELVLEKRAFWSGIDGKVLKDDLARIFNLPQDVGLLVERVAQGSPAEKAGIRGGELVGKIDQIPLLLGGDVILEVDGITLDERDASTKIQKKLNNKQKGDKFPVVVFRGGERKALTAVVRQ